LTILLLLTLPYSQIIAHNQQQQQAILFSEHQSQSGGVGGAAASSLLSAVPIHRVYEMRGTLFHEMQGMFLFDCSFCDGGLRSYFANSLYST